MKNFFRSESGGVLVTFGLSLLVIIGLVGVSIDIARQHAVKIALQKAADAALLGAVATSATLEVQREARLLFNANFPTDYLGARITSFRVNAPTRQIAYASANVRQSSVSLAAGAAALGPAGGVIASPLPPGEAYTGEFEIKVEATVPNVIMGTVLGHADTVLTTEARVLNILEENQIEAEVVLVLDNTGSMSAGNAIGDLRNASHTIVDILFGGKPQLDNLHISIIPYNVGVGVPAAFGSNKVQNFWAPRFDAFANVIGYSVLSNRNQDFPISTHNDVTNVPPTLDELKFRTPSTPYPPSYNLPGNQNAQVHPLGPLGCHDMEFFPMAQVMFGKNVQADLHTHIETMIANGCTRINVGFLWGWLALSPTWQGIWDAAQPNLPRTVSNRSDKTLIVMTDGQNTVGRGPTPNSNDDDSLLALCTAAKNMDTTVYTITLGPGPNPALMSACATSSAHYFHAPSGNQLQDVFTAIGRKIVQEWLRLSR